MKKIMKISRASGRSVDQLRPLKVTCNVCSYAAGSVLFEMGNTKILCSVTIQNSVPYFLRGKKSGWLTAEYSMLPSSTPVRTVREITTSKRSGRAIEISRLIGRSLRAVVDLTSFGENTIFIDCDVLQSDGGTKSAAITGAYLALKSAEAKWRSEKEVLVGNKKLLKDDLAAVSVGLTVNGPLLDMDFSEDSILDAQYDFVLSRSDKVIEIQGSTSGSPITWEDYDLMRMLAVQGIQEVFFFYDTEVSASVGEREDANFCKKYGSSSASWSSRMFTDEQT